MSNPLTKIRFQRSFLNFSLISSKTNPLVFLDLIEQNKGTAKIITSLRNYFRSEELIFLDFSRYSSTGISVYFTLTDFFFIAFQYVSAKFSERILSFSSLVKKFCQFFLTSEAFFPFSLLVKAFSHLKQAVISQNLDLGL